MKLPRNADDDFVPTEDNWDVLLCFNINSGLKRYYPVNLVYQTVGTCFGDFCKDARLDFSADRVRKSLLPIYIIIKKTKSIMRSDEC